MNYFRKDIVFLGFGDVFAQNKFTQLCSLAELGFNGLIIAYVFFLCS